MPIAGFSYGQTELFRVLTIQLPICLAGLSLGGQTTAEIIIGRFVNGLRLWALILVFGAFNTVPDQYSLLWRTPRVLFHAELTLLSIGLYIGFIGDSQGIGWIVAFGALRHLSGSAPHTRYLHERWRDRDTLVTLVSLLVIGGTLVLCFVDAGG